MIKMETRMGTDDLWDDSDVCPEGVEVNGIGGETVVVHLALRDNAAEKRKGQGTLPNH